MRPTIVAIAFLLLSIPAHAQEGVRPDTLDWHDYYPLEIGNVWDLGIDHSFGNLVERVRIEGDTLVDGKKWLIQSSKTEGHQYGRTVVKSDTVLLRYDDPYGRVLARSLETGNEWDMSCDLSGDFGAEVLCGADSGSEFAVEMHGGYSTDRGWGSVVVGSDTIAAAGFKFNPRTSGPVSPVFINGIGPLPRPGDGFDGTIDFVYLRLGGIEYGSPAQFVSAEGQVDLGISGMTLYPNPTSQRLTLEFNGPEVRVSVSVYDLEGRRLIETTCSKQRCGVDVGRLSSGFYMLRVETNSSTRVLRRGFLVAR